MHNFISLFYNNDQKQKRDGSRCAAFIRSSNVELSWLIIFKMSRHHIFLAHPPSTSAFEEFHSDSPAFLLAKVDGDELVHLLESQPSTPFETPRLESNLEIDEEAKDRVGMPPTEFSKGPEKRKTPKDSGPNFIAERPDSLLPPKQVMDDFQVPVPRPGHELSNPTSHAEDTEDDAHLVGPWQEYKGTKWSVSHAKILYLISVLADRIFSVPADQVWVREAHLLVLYFEGFQAGVFSLRIAPSRVIFPTDRDPHCVWWNVPSGWKGCLQDLCRAKLILCLQLVDENFTHSSAFQPASLATPFIQAMPDVLKNEIDGLLSAPAAFEQEAINVEVTADRVVLAAANGFQRYSEIDESESASFITSPYVPLFLRFTNEACTDNAALASQCAEWDETTFGNKVECLCFGNISICLSEYLPLGPNMIQSVSETLGCREQSSAGTRSKSGFLLPTRQKDDSAKYRFTQTTLLDWNFVSQINYESMIQEPCFGAELRRLEHFGIHVNQDGTVLCGVQIEAVSDKEWDEISPELLVRVLYQIQLDSTAVVDNLYPEILYQYLNCVFFGHETKRIKYACLIADLIEPKFPAKQYLDNGKYENELSWVIGNISCAEDLGDDDFILVGSKGLLLIGAHARDHEMIALNYTILMSRNMFLDQLFKRASCLSDSLLKMYVGLLETDEDQERLDSLNKSILEASSDFKKINTVLNHFALSARSMEKFETPNSAVGRSLYDFLRLSEIPSQQVDRARDLEILMERINQDLSCLIELVCFEERKNVARCFSSIQRHTLHLAREKGSMITHSGVIVLNDGCAIRMLITCFSGLLACALLDRINSSALTNTSAPEWFSNTINSTVNMQPLLLFAFQICIVGFFCLAIYQRTKIFEHRSVCFVRRKLTLNVKIGDLMALFRYLDKNGCESVLFKAKVTEIDLAKSQVRGDDGLLTVTYVEKHGFKWFGDAPKVTLEIDVVHGWLKTAEYFWDFWADAQTQVDLEAHVRKILRDSGAVDKH